MYIDDGRYYGPDEIRNAAFKLHRKYLQDAGIDISGKADQVTQLNDDESMNQRQQRLEGIKQQRDVAEDFKKKEEEKSKLAKVQE